MQESLRISRDAARTAQNSAEAASRMAQTMKETAERQLRAYISVETQQLRDKEGKSIPGRAGFMIKNRGLTPAHKVRHWARTLVREYPLNGPLTEKEGKSGSMTVLAPGEEQVITLPFPPVTEQQTGDAIEWKIAMYFYGEVIYEDAFGVERHTRFKLFQSGEGIAIQRLASYHDGNEAG
jgi:hypothetical protein